MAYPKDKLLPAAKPTVDSAWADGLRGIASLFVVSSHITLCFARSIVPPSIGQDGPSKLFQRPFLRLLGQGNAAVAIFFVLLGFVNSLKPIQQSRRGNVKDALSGLASSSFRRTGRLVFPAAAVTVISWFLCQLGFFELARMSNAYWLLATSPAPSASWFQAIKDLVRELVYTWVRAENAYDQPQWALQHLFRGSMCTYMVLLATCNATPAFRLSAEIVLYIWSWISNESIVLFNVFAGMILAELSYILPASLNSKSPTHLRQTPSYALALLGLYLCSYPDSFAHQTRWSRTLLTLGSHIFPQNALLGRFWPGLGAQLLCLSILTSPSLRTLFSSRIPVYLGSISYALYLLHGTLMRTLLAYLVFGPMYLFSASGQRVVVQPELSPDPLVAQPEELLLMLEIVLFCVALLGVVRLWAVRVEPYFARATAGLDGFARSWGKGWTGWSGGGGLAGGRERQNGSVLPITRRD